MMNPKLNTICALRAYTALQSLRLLTNIISIVVGTLLAITAILSIIISPWLWLIAIPLVLITLVFIVLRAIVKSIVARIHRHPFTTRQREQLEIFTGNLKNMAEVRDTSVTLFALRTVWEVLRKRDETMIEKIINDSADLKKNFAELEKHFGER
jgi:ABC-type siderophore export system fused ATPase/permease subunit